MLLLLTATLLLGFTILRWVLEPACPSCTSKRWSDQPARLECTRCGWSSVATAASLSRRPEAPNEQYEIGLS